MTIAVAWPVAVLDIETNRLSRFSYPIETGVASRRGVNVAIETGSSLISPDPPWVGSGYGSRRAGAIHAIAREDLKSGLHPSAACARPNTGCLVRCDSYVFDCLRFVQLCEAAGAKAAAGLESMAELAAGADPGPARWLDANEADAHRVSADVRRAMRAFASGMGPEPSRASPP